MYTFVLILLGIWALVIIVGICRKYYKERRRVRIWLTSQPAETLISGRRKAVERAGALLEGQIDCEDFIDEFGKSEDPEIQRLVRIVTNMSVEEDEDRGAFRKSIEKRVSALEGK